ncbi:MAG TPA: cation transporter [Allosphingosinicella sp.]|uniref:cation transporter n=1 Tax=Allosphingosinicella sp. TaxID=2823234 RepID=UPI002ED780CD
MSDCCASKGTELERLAQQADQRRVLVIVLLLNAFMFVAEFTAGLIAGSAALMADSVDMLGDATVYGVSLYAITRSARWKAGAAVAKGLFIMALGVGVLVQIGIKLETGVPPSSTLMLVFGGLALAVNLYCLKLMWRFRSLDVNMSSTVECSRNDALANAGVLVAAAAVALSGSFWPDIIVAGVIAALFFRSAINMLGEAWPLLRRVHTHS